MSGNGRSGARWVVPILAVALVACAAVVYALIRITSPGGTDAGSSSSAATSSITGSQLVSQTSSLSQGSSATSGATTPSSPSPSTPMADRRPSTTATGTSSASTSTTVPPTTETTLGDSGPVLPAAWSGTATVTIQVLGECATATPSVYTDLPADLAVDLLQNLANKTEVGLPAKAQGNDPIVTLGVNASGVPSITINSAQITDDGTFHRYWRVHLNTRGDRTHIDGTLVNSSAKGSNPNVLVDAETSLQPCAPTGTVSLPRALAKGSTITGFIGTNEARLTVHATTTDGRRAVTITATAQRADS